MGGCEAGDEFVFGAAVGWGFGDGAVGFWRHLFD
jgi:hypothetical protein